MKSLPFVVGTVLLAGTVIAKDPTPKPRVSELGKYPAIIQLTPVDPTAPATPTGLISSDLGGREVEFLQSSRRSVAELRTLADIAITKGASEQVKSVADMLSSMQGTESAQLESLTIAKKLNAPAASTGVMTKELSDLSGGKFEKAWVERLIGTAEGSVQAYEIGTKSSDAQVKLFVEKILPVAKARLQMANRLGGRSVPTPAPAPSASAANAAAAAPSPAPATAKPALAK